MKKYNLFILILFNVSALFSQDSDYEVFKYNNYKEVKLYSVNKIGKNGKYIGKYCLGENINFYKNGFDNDDSVYDFKISIFSKHTDVFYANDRKKRKFYSFSFGDFPYHVYSIDVFNENFDTIFEFKIKFDSLGNYKSIGSYSLVYDSLNRLKFYEAKRGIGVARTDYYSDDKIEVIDSQKDIQFLKNGIKRKIVTYFENGKIISTKTFDYKYDFIERKDYYFLNKEIIFMYDDNNIINYCIFNYYSKNKKGKILCNSYITRVEVIEQK